MGVATDEQIRLWKDRYISRFDTPKSKVDFIDSLIERVEQEQKRTKRLAGCIAELTHRFDGVYEVLDYWDVDRSEVEEYIKRFKEAEKGY